MSGSKTNIFNMDIEQDTTKTDLENVKNNDTSSEQTNSTVIKKMTTEEYDRQGKTCTAKGLAELQEPLKQAGVKKSQSSDSNSPRAKKRRMENHREYFECDDDDYVYSDDDEEEPKYSDNLLIQNARYSTGIPTSSRTSSSSNNRNANNHFDAHSYMQLVGQREIDHQKNGKLKEMVIKLKSELRNRDKDEYHMKLDLNNRTVERDELMVERDNLMVEKETQIKRMNEYKEKCNKEIEELKNTNKNIGFRYTICKWIVIPISFAINMYFMALTIKEHYHP